MCQRVYVCECVCERVRCSSWSQQKKVSARNVAVGSLGGQSVRKLLESFIYPHYSLRFILGNIAENFAKLEHRLHHSWIFT